MVVELGANLGPPLNWAVILCVPGVRAEVVTLAAPALRDFVPSATESTRKVTLLPGVPFGEVTFTLNFTFVPAMDGFTDAIRVVVVGDWIFSVMPPELVMKPASPL